MPKFLRQIARLLLSPVESFTGRVADRARHNTQLRNMPSVSTAIQTVRSRWNIPDSHESHHPIFVLSAGWRSGSTLLQRLVLSAPEILMWGEPYAHCDYIRRMADSLRMFQPDFPRDHFFIDSFHKSGNESDVLTQKWVANLYPMPQDLIEAHRMFLLRLFWHPAEQAGYSRWGIKEVRLSIEYAEYLRFLFPDAKFLFLCRNPYEAYQSYKSFRAWYDVWPSSPILTPRQFGRHWGKLAEGFVDGHDRVGGRLIKYEDLCDDNVDLDELSDYLDLPIDSSVIGDRQTGVRTRDKVELSRLDRMLLRRAVEPIARQLGYSS